MVNNNGMYINYNNPFYNSSSYPGGCCMQGGFMPYTPTNCSYQMRGGNPTEPGFMQAPPYSCPYLASSFQYSPAVPCFSSAEENSFRNNNNFMGYINPTGINMRTVSIEDIIE